METVYYILSIPWMSVLFFTHTTEKFNAFFEQYTFSLPVLGFIIFIPIFMIPVLWHDIRCIKGNITAPANIYSSSKKAKKYTVIKNMAAVLLDILFLSLCAYLAPRF